MTGVDTRFHTLHRSASDHSTETWETTRRGLNMGSHTEDEPTWMDPV